MSQDNKSREELIAHVASELAYPGVVQDVHEDRARKALDAIGTAGGVVGVPVSHKVAMQSDVVLLVGRVRETKFSWHIQPLRDQFYVNVLDERP